jgi:hypothetical protein
MVNTQISIQRVSKCSTLKRDLKVRLFGESFFHNERPFESCIFIITCIWDIFPQFVMKIFSQCVYDNSCETNS